MEPATHDDIWARYLPNQPIKCSLMLNHCQIRTKPDASIMMYHITYACAMAIFAYARHQQQIPSSLEDQAAFWKKYYNTGKGAGEIEEYVRNYQQFTGQVKKPRSK